jgi:hypothetical protein
MKKLFTLACFVVGTLVAIAWLISSYSENNRFIVTNAGDGAVYKTDKKTGKTTILYQGRELDVQQYVFVQPTPVPTPKQETAEERTRREEAERSDLAVVLAKQAKTMSANLGYMTPSNEDFLANWLRQQKGDIRIGGWSAKKVDDQTYLVTFAVVRDGKSEGVRFEVNLAAKLVRNIKGDSVLEEKYSDA